MTLRGEVRDVGFVRFFEQLSREALESFTTDDFLVLDHIQREELLPLVLRPRVARLVDLGAVERIGRGRGVRFLLSRRYYDLAGRAGAYTRKVGLDRETHKELLVRHLRRVGEKGSDLQELHQVLPMVSRNSLQKLLQQLKAETRVELRGVTRAARWFSTSATEPIAPGSGGKAQ